MAATTESPKKSTSPTTGDTPVDDSKKVTTNLDGNVDPISKVPDMALANLRFTLTNPVVSLEDKNKVWKEEIMPLIKERNMAPFYREVCTETLRPTDATLLAEMIAENETRLTAIDEEIKDAETNLGESEIREAWNKKAEYMCTIGNKEGALSAFRQTYDKTVGIGNRIDVVLQQIRIGLFYGDHDLVKTNMSKVKELMEQGGDWDRRNRLKAYEGLHLMATRDFKNAAKLFLEAVPTFGSYELMSYDDLVVYTVITAMIALERPALKSEIMRGSEMQEQLTGGEKGGVLNVCKQYVESFYECDFKQFFVSLADLEVQRIKMDRFLVAHTSYYSRAMRVKAYQQFLAPYKSVSLSSMATEFGVSEDYMDSQLHRFVASGRLHCRIDAVRGIVETVRLDAKNDAYKSVISHGDVLLNRIQKLARVVNE